MIKIITITINRSNLSISNVNMEMKVKANRILKGLETYFLNGFKAQAEILQSI